MVYRADDAVRQMQAQRAELNRTSAAEESPKVPEDAQ